MNNLKTPELLKATLLDKVHHLASAVSQHKVRRKVDELNDILGDAMGCGLATRRLSPLEVTELVDTIRPLRAPAYAATPEVHKQIRTAIAEVLRNAGVNEQIFDQGGAI